VIAVIGPSAAGKSAVVRELHRRGLVTVHPTWTTRPRRPDEQAGSFEHRFVSDAAFNRLPFAAVGSLPGLPYRYGLMPVPTAGVVLLRAPFVPVLAELVPDLAVVEIVDRPARIAARLRDRGSGAAEVEARLADVEREADEGRDVADLVFVNRSTIADLADRVAGALAS
jgi:ribose 1,5-bisphosphokinase PhnN